MSPPSAWGLIAPVLLGVALESYEIRIQYKDVGLLSPGNDAPAVIFSRHFRDVLIVCAIPLLLVIVGFVKSRNG